LETKYNGKDFSIHFKSRNKINEGEWSIFELHNMSYPFPQSDIKTTQFWWHLSLRSTALYSEWWWRW